MARTMIATGMMLAIVCGGLYLVRGSQLEAPVDMPARFQPESSARRLSTEPGQTAEPTATTQRLSHEAEASDALTCEGSCCCTDDRVPSREELIALGLPLPADPHGRWMSPTTADIDEIPVPQFDRQYAERPYIRLLDAEEEFPADDNEPAAPSQLQGPLLGPATDDDNAVEPPAPETPTETEASEEKEAAAQEPERLVVPEDTTKLTEKKPAAEPKKTADEPRVATTPLPPQPAKPNYPPQLEPLKRKIRYCLAHYYFRRQENAATRSPWGVMHSMIPFGVDAQLVAGNRRVNTIGWLCYNGNCQNQNLFYVDRASGGIQARIGVGVQGHAGQFLAMLAQSKVMSNFSMQVESKKFTVEDLIEYEKYNCRAGTELTFKLISFAHYLPSDATWRNDQGEYWDIPRVIREELKQPIIGAACGGTHRLMGLSYAVHNRSKQKQPIDGQWLRAERFTASYQNYLLRLQNSDGSFSTDWFKGRADNGKPTRKLETTGHMLEWLVYSLPEERLTDARVIRAVDFLSSLLLSDPNGEWKIGPQGHGLHALALYDERVFGGKPGQRATELAEAVRTQRR